MQVYAFTLVGFLADMNITCAELPQILLSPPSPDGNYVVEVGREVEIQCLLEPNLYSSVPVTITSYRVDGNEMTMIGIVYAHLFEKVNMVHIPFIYRYLKQ